MTGSPIELRLDAALAAFRTEVRAFLAAEMAPERTRLHADPTDLTGLDLAFEQAHQRRAGERGYLAISAPVAYGGGGRPPSWRAVYSFEAAYYDAPSIDTAMTLCGAALLASASEEQKLRLIPPMARGEVLWCLAYTEPGAGSDLSCVASTATPVGDGFVLDGEKALVTGAHKAELCLTIARTSWSPPSREGLTMFVVDLASPGVTVRRRQTANGWTLGELVFDGVQLDAASVVGEVGAGWRQMAAALVDERSGAAHLGWATRLLDDLWEWAVTSARDDACEPIAALRADLAVGYRLAERVLARQDASEPAHVEAAMSKVWVTELLQRIARTGQDVVGVDALAWSPLFGENAPAVTLSGRLAYERIERIHPTISVGANELQRDTIARAALSLGAKR